MIFFSNVSFAKYEKIFFDYDIDTIGSHGTMVLSCMGGYMLDSLIGTAPESSYLLYRTEDTSSETITEEDNWVAAMERADISGAHVINTSLGYSNNIVYRNKSIIIFNIVFNTYKRF